MFEPSMNEPAIRQEAEKEAIKIAVIGLGYVGLPLARLFATKYPVVGYDINRNRIEELQKGKDTTLEVEDDILKKVLLQVNPLTNNSNSDENTAREDDRISPKTGLFCTPDLMDIQQCNYYIVTVPTPVDKNHRPVLTPLYGASEAVGRVLKKGDTVIYESTVYPGVTEDEC